MDEYGPSGESDGAGGGLTVRAVVWGIVVLWLGIAAVRTVLWLTA